MSFECSNREPMSESITREPATTGHAQRDIQRGTDRPIGGESEGILASSRRRLWLHAQFVACAVMVAACGGGSGSTDSTSQPVADTPSPSPSPAPSPAPATSGSATLSWQAPQTNADGSALTDLAGFRIYYGTASGSYSQTINVADPTATRYTISSLPGSATYFFVLRAYDKNNVESAPSPEVSKTIQ